MEIPENTRLTGFACRCAVVFASAMLLPYRAQAQTFTVVHNFSGIPDGSGPEAGLIRDPQGNYYGVTSQGGNPPSPGEGTIFKLDATGKETVLYRFSFTDGNNPVGGLIRDSAGNLYGTTLLGCSASYGNVFKLDSNNNLTSLYCFTGVPDGADPYAALVRDSAGNLYGTTIAGGGRDCLGYNGNPDGCGVVFELDSSGHETLLHRFTGSPDGAEPYAGLIQDSEGNLYGTTSYGGTGNCRIEYAPKGCGTVFKLDKSGTLTVLHSFTGPILEAVCIATLRAIFTAPPIWAALTIAAPTTAEPCSKWIRPAAGPYYIVSALPAMA